MAAQDNKSLVDILVKDGALSPAVAEKIKLAEVQTGKAEEDLIRDQNLVTEKALTIAKAAFYNVPYIDLESTPINPDALSFVQQNLASRFNVFPVNVDRFKKEITIAMADPLDLSAIEFIEQKTRLRVKPVSADPSVIANFIATRYTTSLSQEVTEALKDVEPSLPTRQVSTAPVEGQFIRGEKIGEVINKILEFAVKSRASDVHIEPQFHQVQQSKPQ